MHASSPSRTVEERPVDGSEKYANLDRIAPNPAAVSSGALFEVGLEVLLDGIERRLERVRAAPLNHEA